MRRFIPRTGSGQPGPSQPRPPPGPRAEPRPAQPRPRMEPRLDTRPVREGEERPARRAPGRNPPEVQYQPGPSEPRPSFSQPSRRRPAEEDDNFDEGVNPEDYDQVPAYDEAVPTPTPSYHTEDPGNGRRPSGSDPYSAQPSPRQSTYSGGRRRATPSSSAPSYHTTDPRQREQSSEDSLQSVQPSRRPSNYSGRPSGERR